MSIDSLPPKLNAKLNSRRNFLRAGMSATVATAAYPALGSARVVDPPPAAGPAVPNLEQNFKKNFELDEITIDDLQKALQSGQDSFARLPQKYPSHIHETYTNDPHPHSTHRPNPHH